MKTVGIHFRTTDDLRAWLVQYREETGVPTNTYLNRLIEADRKRKASEKQTRPKRTAASA